MARKPGVWLYRGFWRSNAGGVPQQKLCPEEMGKKHAELCLARLLVERADAETKPAGPGIRPPAAEMPVQVAFDDFLDMKKSETSAGTYKYYVECLTPFFDRFGGRELRSIGPKDGYDYKAWLINEKTWGKGKTRMRGLGPVSVNHRLRAAKELFRWCCKPSRKYLLFDPWEEISYLPEKGRERIITDEEFLHLLSECRAGRGMDGGTAEDYREILTMLRRTTMRPGELRKLLWEYVVWEKHKIVFPAEVVKTKSRRPVTLIPEAETVLLNRKQRLLAAGRKPQGYVFTVSGRQIGMRQLSHWFHRVFARCVAKGLIENEKRGERLVVYSTRHTRVTELITSGVHFKAVMDEAGHKLPSTTIRYVHLADDLVTEAVRNAAATKGGEKPASPPPASSSE